VCAISCPKVPASCAGFQLSMMRLRVLMKMCTSGYVNGKLMRDLRLHQWSDDLNFSRLCQSLLKPSKSVSLTVVILIHMKLKFEFSRRIKMRKPLHDLDDSFSDRVVNIELPRTYLFPGLSAPLSALQSPFLIHVWLERYVALPPRDRRLGVTVFWGTEDVGCVRFARCPPPESEIRDGTDEDFVCGVLVLQGWA